MDGEHDFDLDNLHVYLIFRLARDGIGGQSPVNLDAKSGEKSGGCLIAIEDV